MATDLGRVPKVKPKTYTVQSIFKYLYLLKFCERKGGGEATQLLNCNIHFTSLNYNVLLNSMKLIVFR